MKLKFKNIREIRNFKLTKRRFLQGFAAVVLLLALVRLFFPSVAESRDGRNLAVHTDSTVVKTDSVKLDEADTLHAQSSPAEPVAVGDTAHSPFFNADGSIAKHRIFSVPHFGNTFPDQNDVQLLAAQRHGVKPVRDREEAEQRKDELVYVGSNPFFYIDNLKSSIAYLVPRASVLLQDIGRAYFDSLQVKGIPLHKIIVSSVLRTKNDVEKLRGHNANATQNSCHLYGTTFDVCYNRYKTVEAPGEPRRKVTNDTLKWVLSEVLRDMREQQRCLVKYEVKQGCFHITVN